MVNTKATIRPQGNFITIDRNIGAIFTPLRCSAKRTTNAELDRKLDNFNLWLFVELNYFIFFHVLICLCVFITYIIF